MKSNHALIERAARASRFVAENLSRSTHEPPDPARLLRPRAEGEPLVDRVAIFGDGQADAGLMRRLREVRREQMMRIAVRALSGVAELPETLADLSDLAEACCDIAVRSAMHSLVGRHGRPFDEAGKPAVPVVLGMGKLGGGELNFSSDIDLIFLHSAEGQTEGGRSLDNAGFFVRLAQEVGRLLATHTEHGFVFRVDTMLRPFGSAGPMSMGFDAAEEYYQTQGREWERYALIKARPVAGDLAAGELLLKNLRPFVYRRYLDFNAIGSLRDLKRRIHDDVIARRVTEDVKLGAGGIREVEFIVQSFQLVRGGQDARLRDSRLRPVLAWLGESGLLGAQTASELDQAYVFLRRLENAIQMYADQQTHRLPESADAREALCMALDFPSWDALRVRLAQVCGFVHGEFQRVFAEAPRTPSQSAVAALIPWAFDPGVAAAELSSRLGVAGFGETAQGLAQRLIDLARGRLARGLSESASQRLRQLLVRTMEECAATAAPAQTAERVLQVLQAVAGRTTYLTLLDESAIARAHLVRLCAASRWVTEHIAASPAVLDTLIDPRTLFAPPDREAMQRELQARLAQIAVEDTEAGMDVLRRYRNEITVRIAAADVAGVLPLVKVSDHLTWLAEVVLMAAIERAQAEIERQYGTLRCDDGATAAIGAIAYGKFGGIELGYGSDLDLVFIHDDVPAETESSGGTRALYASAYFTRLSQRVVHWLSTLTPAGRAYEVDLELRPSGQSGAPVSSLSAFSRYQREQAWTWEHQALTRARFTAGPASLGHAFSDLRCEVLCRPREPVKLAVEIVEMRDKMRTHLEKRRTGLWDVKQGRGGVIDCEFLTQYLMLRDACRHPSLAVWSDNWRQLDALAEAGSIESGDKDRLIECYRAYRALAHARALQSEEALTEIDVFAAERESVQSIWERCLGVRSG
ncbi:MAG: bifunctional [glutamate--ammonia ligase]-adenylyl-L-tyrosine phosphorylase/[glutamate--ammonia-ligase] adenylyltransferase [Panacagrimonas sp.]